MENISFEPLYPELVLLLGICITLLQDLWNSDRRRIRSYWFTQATFIVALIILPTGYGQPDVSLYNGQFVRDDLSVVMKMAILVIGMLSVLYSRSYINHRRFYRGEYYVLMQGSVLGMMVLISAHSLLSIYLGLELLSLCLYALIAMQRGSSTAPEAAIKYFVMGAIASGFLLYGMSLTYGVTESLKLSEVMLAASSSQNNLVLAFGLVFMVAGIAFKLGAVPFHMWLPDVYHGAPTSVTAFLSSAPKIAALAMIIRLLFEAMGSWIEQWQDMLMLMSVLSMALGNLLAVAQTSIRRMLAYSTIAHMGYLLLGVVAGTSDGMAAALFYSMVYALMSVAAFAMVIFMSRSDRECDALDDFKGVAKNNPWFALVMTLILSSLAGLPPFVGFWGKLQVIGAVIKQDMLGLAVFAIVTSIVGLFYYLRVIRLMFFESPERNLQIQVGRDCRVALSVNGLALLLLGIMPSGLLAICRNVFL